MEKNDNNEFGKFLLQLRKDKRLTQRELAQKLYISDKAVSKWERGLSMPDIALLMPLPQILGVTATELLSGKKIEENRELSVREVESLMNRTIHLSEEEKEQQSKNRQNRIMIFFSCVFIVGLELAISRISPTLWEKGELIFTLGSVLSMFIPIYVAGKKYA